MKINKFVALIIILFFGCCLFVFFIFEGLIDGYRKLEIEDQIHGKITKMSSYKGEAYIYLNDSIRSILPYSRNSRNSPEHLFDFLKNGDILKKESNSDTIYINRNDELYIFLLGKEID